MNKVYLVEFAENMNGKKYRQNFTHKATAVLYAKDVIDCGLSDFVSVKTIREVVEDEVSYSVSREYDELICSPYSYVTYKHDKLYGDI